MPAFIRTLALFGAVLCLASGLLTLPAHAATQHHKKHHHHVSKKHKATQTSSSSRVRQTQTFLANLDYYTAKIDGLNGRKTKAAIKAFQLDHQIAATGKLTQQTFDAIVEADKERAMASLPAGEPQSISPPLGSENENAPTKDFYAANPDFYGAYNQSYENPLLLGPTQALNSRFAKVDLSEDTTAGTTTRRYNVALNGLPLILVDGQTSVIGVSRTFALGDEDVIIFTSFKDHDPVCAYTYNLLILSANGNKSRTIQNCTRGYQAKAANGTLFITFPEPDDERALGSVWRYDKGDLEKL